MRCAVAITLACLSGCASYRYDVEQPARFAGPVAGSFELAPLRYTPAVVDDRLSIRVDNPTADTVRLSGTESSVVDPAGRSHPLVDQTIAAGAYAVVVLPPLRPWFGATADVGTPVVIQTPGGPTPAEQRTTGEGPGDDPGVDRASPVFWDWPGVGRVRVRLVYRRADGTRFEHELAFDRRRG